MGALTIPPAGSGKATSAALREAAFLAGRPVITIVPRRSQR